MNREQYLQRFKQITDEIFEITKAKNSDYAGEGNPFQNFELCEKLGCCSTKQGFIVRMGDKLQRITNLLDKENQVKDEKITDTLQDLACYSILFLLYLESNE